MPDICGDTVGDRLRGLLVSYWLETQREMHPQVFLRYLDIAQSVCYSVSVCEKVFRIFGHFSKRSLLGIA
jgi:hypothetical protein